MDQAEYEHIAQRLDREVRERFPDAPVQRVDVLRHGDDPGVEPGQLLVRVVIDTPDGDDERKQAFEAFHDAHREAFHELRRELDKLPVTAGLQFTTAASLQPDCGDKGPVFQLRGPRGFGDAPGLTAVMARLGQEDLETLDLLISAGIAGSRAEAVRWALARIRERPAYEQLRARTHEIQELRTQF
jgi:hypothetical protein